jgi:quercetin dioxygenase-like cupin family protein
MENRRWFFSILAALTAATSRLRSAPQEQSAPPRQSRTAGVIPLPPPFDKQSATLTELYVPPGRRSKAHRHAGFVLGYVIEGEFRFQIAGQPERILRSGDTFYEPPGATHLISESASPDRPARVLAIVIADSDTKKLTEPA